MRQFVFAFSFVFLFVQSMQPAYAVLPFLNVVGATFRAGGAFLKGSKFVKGANFAWGGATMAWCIKNRKKCLDLGGDVAEQAIDSYEKNKNDDDDDTAKNGCVVRFGDKKLTMSAFISSVSRTDDMGSYTIKYYANSETKSELERYARYALDGANKNNSNWFSIHGYYPLSTTTKDKISGDESDSRDTFYVSVYYKCGSKSSEKSEQDLFDEIKEKLSDDDAQDIINNYYNETENTFNIEQYCATSNACLDIDNEFSKELNTKDYDYTKISKENCEVENDKIVSCEKAKKTKSDDDNSDNTNKDDKRDDDSNNNNNSNNTNKKDDDSDNQKIKCNSSEFHKKVCDFIDWYQDDDLNADDDSKVKVKDLSDDLKIDDDRIKFGYSCPASDSFSFSLFSKTFTYSISYNGLCDSFLKLRPFVIGFSYIIGGMIVLGRKI